MAKTNPAAAEDKLATLLIGVDSLFGADVMHESGAHHFIADSWILGISPPPIYGDSFPREARSSGDILKDAQAVNAFVNRWRLHVLPQEIKELSRTFKKDDKRNISDLTDSLSVILDTAVADVDKTKVPSFEQRYRAGTANTVDYIGIADPRDAREKLRETLAQVGYEVSPSRNLRETVLVWGEAQKPLAPEKVADEARKINAELLTVMRSNVFSKLNFRVKGHNHDLSDVAFDGHRFETISGVHFTGSSIYQGGEKEGVPTLKGLFEYNTDHPVTEISLTTLCAHEVIGHYINAAVKDLLWRDGQLGFLATIGVMCSPQVVFEEGWAQNIFELMYGSRDAAAEVYGKHLLVALAHEDLQDFGKHNASILYQRDGASLDDVRRHLTEDCVQADHIVKKLSGAWAQHPVLGPLYGPAYLKGREMVNAAIREHGNVAVAEIGYHLKGLVHIGTFQEKVARL
ncbi:MAG TPA: hypothetical protein VJC39_00405 [Candidatus Nanoarchaeia archaeon]|nr:hypothetical protein [Candidatus Nanoarchaeia archaeon]